MLPYEATKERCFHSQTGRGTCAKCFLPSLLSGLQVAFCETVHVVSVKHPVLGADETEVPRNSVLSSAPEFGPKFRPPAPGPGCSVLHGFPVVALCCLTSLVCWHKPCHHCPASRVVRMVRVLSLSDFHTTESCWVRPPVAGQGPWPTGRSRASLRHPGAWAELLSQMLIGT